MEIRKLGAGEVLHVVEGDNLVQGRPFSRKNLQGGRFTGQNIYLARFDGADLRGASFWRAVQHNPQIWGRLRQWLDIRVLMRPPVPAARPSRISRSNLEGAICTRQTSATVISITPIW